MHNINKKQILITIIALLSIIIVIGLYSGINNIFHTTTSTSQDFNVLGSAMGTTTSTVGRPDAAAADTNPTTDVTSNTPTDTETEPTISRVTPPLQWSTYVNKRYGFSLRVPGTKEDVVNYPDGREECSTEYLDTVADKPYVTAARINGTELQIAVICAPFTKELTAAETIVLSPSALPEDQVIGTFSPLFPNAITRSLTTSVGYTWTIIQVPLDKNHYLEIAHSYGNSNYVNNDPELTETDFQTIVKSLTVK